MPASDFVWACNLDELEAKGRLVVHGRHPPILLIHDGGRVFALDNRCPHMGFPLERGSVEDGILTCHWHHARFDLASGCTFDLWADDVPTCPVEIRNGHEVWIRPAFGHADPSRHWQKRLDDGLAHDLSLVIAKAVQGQLAAGVSPASILRQAVLFGVQNRDDWSTGLTILTGLGNLLPILPDEEVYLALFHGIRRVAADCEGQPLRRERMPLTSHPDPAALERWLRRWSGVRHREAAERTLLTAIATGMPQAELADLLFSTATDRIYADSGHSLDFVSKAFECLDLIGWEHAASVLPSVVGQMTAARGAEEMTAWRHPIDLVTLCGTAADELRDPLEANRGEAPWTGHVSLAESLLGDDPSAILQALQAAARDGAAPTDLGRSLVYAAALRVAQFGTANEHADWETAHHVFTYCNAAHQALKRIEAGRARAGAATEAVRGVLHGAMAIYLARYLNVPPARLPGDGDDRLDDLPAAQDEIRAALLDAFDRQQQVETAGRLVARHLRLGHPPSALIATLARALLREDAGFHAYQILEAGVRQFHAWGNTDQGRHILVAIARYLAAHFPTERSALQTADMARRLLRGGQLHENAGT
ncbi:Rieske (2Fe-2S) protein [Microvirga massiliensis]|uniref:Rieske (2Fe-2S) protein n=1 Tax=Microvirga massiliensis TaxID=1033741 RepID=UPI001FCD28AE|nr:Rieske (2Fe-2S) protein [Microvirga massiliensis]